jgi:hypothetical protein
MTHMHATQRDWPALLDELERVLIEQLGLRCAHARADELLDEAARAAALRDIEAARAAHHDVQMHDGATLLEQLERARRREAEAETILRSLDAWHARERAREQLAVDVFVGASSLGPARNPAWLPGSSAPTVDRTSTPVLLRDAKVRFCGHFEPEVALLIHDAGLGTLAMVQVVDASTIEGIHTQVRQYVDRATYLRHLLLTARDQDPGRDHQVISVELVLVHGSHDVEADIDLLYEVGEILRQLAQRTDFLHAIGVNVLAAQPSTHELVFAPAQLRRAFSWLLHDTRRWFSALEQRRRATAPESPGVGQGGRGSPRDGKDESPGVGQGGRGSPRDGKDKSYRLREIQLDEYRLPGRRTLKLHEHTRLHLLHGHNGSGKSSLVEALELMITGGIERLSGIDDYEHVVRNRWSQTPARIDLLTDSEPLGFELHGSDRPKQALAQGSRAASFRLDQTVMDRLARASDVDRAAELLSAFFADEAEVRERWRLALAEAEAVLARVPERARRWLESQQRERQELHDVAVEQLGCLAERRVDARLVDAILPIPRASLRPLLGQLDALAQLDLALERDGHVASDDPLWVAIEQAFARFAQDLPERLRTVEAVLRTADRLGRWWQEEQGGGFDSEAAFAEALDEWLELTALVEITEQQGRVLSSLRGGVERGWDLRRLDEARTASGLLRSLAEVEPIVLADLEHARVGWSKRRDQLGRALRRSSEPVTADEPGLPGQPGQPGMAARVHLDDEEIDELDRFGTWWAPDERGPGLGKRIHAAVERGETHRFANAEIGVHAWVVPIHTAAKQMLGPLRELSAILELGRMPTAPAKETSVPESWPEPEPSTTPVLFDDDLDEWGEMDDTDPAPEAPAEAEDAPTPTTQTTRSYRGPTTEPRPAAAQSHVVYRGPPPASAPTRSPAPPPAQRSPEPTPARRDAKPAAAKPAAVPSITPVTAVSVPAQPAQQPSVSSSKLPRPDRFGLAALIERLLHVYEVSHRAHEVGTEVQASFVMRLAANDTSALGLIDALNELMALFTPARWAYEDVTLRYQVSGPVSRLRFETGELRGGDDPHARARADLRLNTAQLNAFTLALFLLCAPRVENPLGLLVLDDPLQNMDELTVTTLARGLAKLLRVLPTRWSLMMLFHGEGDLARFHDEVECGVYFLPWLSPTVRGQQVDIRCHDEDSRLHLTPQPIDGLVALSPK